jgi:hypothetical protein
MRPAWLDGAPWILSYLRVTFSCTSGVVRVLCGVCVLVRRFYATHLGGAEHGCLPLSRVVVNRRTNTPVARTSIRHESQAAPSPTDRSDRDRCEFRGLLPAVGCIGRLQFEIPVRSRGVVAKTGPLKIG